eukprot:3481403-Rhodomonas_salina.1
MLLAPRRLVWGGNIKTLNDNASFELDQTSADQGVSGYRLVPVCSAYGLYQASRDRGYHRVYALRYLSLLPLVRAV